MFRLHGLQRLITRVVLTPPLFALFLSRGNRKDLVFASEQELDNHFVLILLIVVDQGLLFERVPEAAKHLFVVFVLSSLLHS